jgi:hypothetical protein
MAGSFQPKFVDLVRNYTTSSGTGSFTLGTAVNGYASFATALEVGDSFYYAAIGVDKPAEREIGRGTLLAGGKISRDPISGTATNFSTGTKALALVASAEWFSAAQDLVASVTPVGQSLATAVSSAAARTAIGLGSCSTLDSDADAALAANSDTRLPTQKAVRAYVDAHPPAGALLAANNLSDVTSAATARTALGLGNAAVEQVTRFAVTVPDRASLAGYSAATTAYLRESGREGLFVWSSANNSTNIINDPNQGVYVAPSSDATGASGAWVRKFSGAHNVKWFGAAGDGVTDDSAAFVAALAYLKATAVNLVNTYYKASGKLLIPAGHYYLGTTTIEISHTLTIEGEGGGAFGAGGGAATKLRWADGTTGIRVQEYNTSSASSVDASPFHLTGAYTMLRGLYLYGGYAGAESESHGIHTKTKVILDDVHVDNFAGDALYVHTSNGAGSPNEGNSNCSRAYNCHFRNCRDGLSITGGDANAWLFTACFFDYNRRWGVNDTSFLGNSYIGCHEDSNGITPNSASFGASVVSYSGNRYACVYNQEANASVTAPSGTSADTAYWFYLSPGAANTASLYIPAWSGGMTLRAGGPMLLYNGNQNSAVWGNYTEGGQGPIQQTALGMVLGGSNNTGVKGGSWLRGYVGNYLRTSPLIVQGNQQQWQRSGESFIIDGGQDSTSLSNVALSLKTGIANTGSSALNFQKSDASVMGKVWCVANFGLIADGALGFFMRTNGVDTANTNATGLNIATGKNLQLGGTVIVDSSRNGSFVALSATSTIGYATGAGGTVIQATSKSTGVTLNKACGQVTMAATALAASAAVSFIVTNSTVGATDTIELVLASGNATAGTYNYQIDKVSAGSFVIWVKNISAGSLSEALVFNFSVTKAVSA